MTKFRKRGEIGIYTPEPDSAQPKKSKAKTNWFKLTWDFFVTCLGILILAGVIHTISGG